MNFFILQVESVCSKLFSNQDESIPMLKIFDPSLFPQINDLSYPKKQVLVFILQVIETETLDNKCSCMYVCILM